MNRKRSRDVSSPLGLPTFTRLRLRAAVFLAGAAAMALGISGGRIIGPHFGMGSFVWTSLLTVMLLALASGYGSGGKLADRRPSLLLFSGVLLAAAAAIAVIPLFRGAVLEAGWKFGLRGGSLFATTLLFFPALLLLGMVSPIAVRLEADGVEQAGRSAGRLHAVFLVGSAAGAVLAGYLLLPSFRVPVVLFVLSGTLVLAAILGAGPGLGKRGAGVAVAIVIGGIVVAWPSPMPWELLGAGSADGNDLRVISYEGNRYLFVDQAVQTSVNAEGRTREKHLYFLASRVLLARPKAKSAALVGLGGCGIIPLLMGNGIDMDCVDPSSGALELARGHLGLPLPPARVHAMDGRVFLKTHPGKFDAIILDALTGERTAYPLVSREGLEIAKSALTPGGLLALNTWGIDEEKTVPNQAGAAIHATLQQAFKQVLAIPASGNLLFIASDEPILPQRSSVLLPTFDVPRHFGWTRIPPVTWPDAAILTDDSNPLETFDTAMVDAIRFSRWATLPVPVRNALLWE